MELMQVSELTGVALHAISTVLNSYQAFRQSNVEKYFGELIKSNQDLKAISTDEELQSRFYYIIDQVAKERNQKKLNAWKNATISLAVENIDFDEVDGHFQTLEYLTYFDLLVLYKIYTTDFNEENFKKEILYFFQCKGVEKENMLRSVRQLALHHLINEQYESTAVVAGAKASLRNFHYSKNGLGKKFLNFVYRDANG
jgi:hypothetical protein